MMDRFPRLAMIAARAWLDSRRPLPGPPQAPQSLLSYRVGLLDIDINLHLTNSRYLFYMDLGRWDLFLRSGLVRKSLKENLSLAMVELDMKFRQELKPLQPFVLDSRVVEIRSKLITFEQHFLVGDRVHARAFARTLLTQNRKVIVPQDFMGMISTPLRIQNWRVVHETAHPLAPSRDDEP